MSSGSSGTHSIATVKPENGANTVRLEKLRQRSIERRQAAARLGQGNEQTDNRLRKADDESLSSSTEQLSTSTAMRKVEGDERVDSFGPALNCTGARDIQIIMDVALYRLSKKHKRVGEIHRYDLPDGYVEVSAGAHGMATVWDYDIVLMMVSHLTDAMNRHRDGRADTPGRVFRASISDILKFARRGDGSRQAVEVEAALDRLQSTTIKIVREKGKFRTTEAEGLIARYRVLSRTDTKKISSVEIEAPEWLYREVVSIKRPLVLAVHPDYFLIKSGIDRFIYRQARRAAGKNSAKWSFQKLYERSGSSGTTKKFFNHLLCLVRSDNLPEYTFKVEAGQSGPQLVMRYRGYLASPNRG